MKRLLFPLVTVLLALMLGSSAVMAANPHFVGPVTSNDNGTTLTVSGSIAGLGNQNIDVQVDAVGTATTTCTNPGGNVAPGQTKTVSTTGTASNLEVKNGRVNFSVETDEPTTPAGACPNAKWTPTITDVTFTSFTVSVIQPAGSGNVVLSQTFTP